MDRNKLRLATINIIKYYVFRFFILNTYDRKCVIKLGSWNRVMSMTSPRVTTQNSSGRQIESLKWTMFPQSLNGISTTSGLITTRAWQQGRNEPFIQLDGENQNLSQ